MVIERIYIESFGALKNFHLNTNSRINVFFGGNESGKSTLAAFIKFIFYGYNPPKEDEHISLDKKLYTPWYTDKAAGNIIVYHKDKKYKIEREFAERDKTRIVDLQTNMAIQDGEEPGEFFFKMPEEVFVKTAFLKQFDTSETGGKGLAEMIENIMFTADEDINTRKTLEKLENAKNQLLTVKDDDTRQGIIANLIKTRDALKKSFEESVKDQRELLQMEGVVKELEEKMLANNAKKIELTDELENYKAYNAGRELQKIENSRRQVNTLEKAYKKVIDKYAHEGFVPTAEYSRELMDIAAELNTKKEKLNQHLLYRKTALEKYNECLEKNKSFKIIEFSGGIEEIGDEYTNMKRSENVFNILGFLCMGLMLLTFCGVAFAHFFEKTKNIFVLAIPGVFIIPIVLFFILKNKKNHKIENFYKSFEFETESEFAAVLDDYPDTEAQLEVFKADLDICSDKAIECEKEFDEVYSRARQLLLKWNKTPESDEKDTNDFIKFANLASEANEEILQAKSMYEQHKAQFDLLLEGVNENELKRLASLARKPNYDEKQIVRELEYLGKTNEHMHHREHEIEKNIAVASKLPDPVVLYSQILFLENKIEELTQKYESLSLAIETLEQSCDELKNSVSPRLSETASNFFKLATGGKYSDLTVDSILELDFNDNLTAKDIDFLSSGTKDIAYMCLRMALLDMLFDNELPPVICDDSFSRLDKTRLESVGKMIDLISRKAQVFIFTCHEREAVVFQRLDANVITI